MNLLALVLCAGTVTSCAALSPAVRPDVEAGDGSAELPPLPQCLPRDLSSWRYKHYEEEVKVMQLGKVTAMTLVKEHYDHPVICVQDATFGFTATTLWVSGGCRGRFTVCYNTSDNVDGKMKRIVARTDERFSGMANQMAEIKADQSRQMKMLNYMDKLNKRASSLFNNLDSRCSKQEQELTYLKTVKKQDMVRLKSDQAKEINSLKSSVYSNKQDFMKEIKSLESQSAQQNIQIRTLQTSEKNFIDKTKCKAASVAFSAGLKVHTQVRPYQTVVYNRIMATNGGGYNVNTGIFTCQVPGMYTFNVEVLAQLNQLADLQIYHNNNKIARLYVDRDQGHNSGSTSVMVQLGTRDTVQVKTAQSTAYMHDAAHGPHNTFSGIRTPDLLQDCA